MFFSIFAMLYPAIVKPASSIATGPIQPPSLESASLANSGITLPRPQMPARIPATSATVGGLTMRRHAPPLALPEGIIRLTPHV